MRRDPAMEQRIRRPTAGGKHRRRGPEGNGRRRTAHLTQKGEGGSDGEVGFWIGARGGKPSPIGRCDERKRHGPLTDQLITDAKPI